MKITVFYISAMLIALGLLSCNRNIETILYHEYSPTASSWDVIEWNTSKPIDKNWIIKEIVDRKGRVIELQFLKDGKLIEDPLCYLANKVKFEYTKTSIVEILYHFDEEIIATECEMKYKTIYHLDNNKYIHKIESFAKYDFEGLDSVEIANWHQWVPEYSMVSADSVDAQIEYYYHSFAKFKELYPISKNYKLDRSNYYFGSEPEEKSISKGIKKYEL